MNNNVRLSDPTKTITLRNAFAQEMRTRFKTFTRDVVYAIVKEDCLGLSEEPLSAFKERYSPGYKRFAYLPKDAKIESFIAWVNELQRKRLLNIVILPQIGQAINANWTDVYLESAYVQGIKRAMDEMTHIGMRVPRIAKEGAFQIAREPIHIDRLSLIYTRAYSELKGITTAMDTQISSILAQAMLEGKGPKEIAGAIADVLIGGQKYNASEYIGKHVPSMRRAELLARTETIRAHHLATIQQYRNWGVIGIKYQAEWKTAGDNKVCELCESQDGQIFTLDEIEGLIPLHPNCRCMALPWSPDII